MKARIWRDRSTYNFGSYPDRELWWHFRNERYWLDARSFDDLLWLLSARRYYWDSQQFSK